MMSAERRRRKQCREVASQAVACAKLTSPFEDRPARRPARIRASGRREVLHAMIDLLIRSRREAGCLLSLAAPIMVNNLATTGMGFIDTVMAGRIDAETLGAVAIGHSVFMLPYLLGMGILMAVNPLTAHRVGAGARGRVGRVFRQAVWLALLLGAVLVFALRSSVGLLAPIGIDPALIPDAAGYMRTIAFGLPGLFLFLALRFTSEGIGHTRPIIFTALVGFAVNLAANWVLMFGHLGFPALGAAGCGIASALAHWSMMLTLLAYVLLRRDVYRRLNLFSRLQGVRPALMREIVSLGLPIGGSVLAEASMFSCVGLLMGTLGASIAGAHQIAMNYASMMFMVPLSLHSAITVRVGQALGAGRRPEAGFRAWVGIAMCGAVMVVSAGAMLLEGERIVNFYLRDGGGADVRAVAVSLLLMAAVFQVSDGLQVGAAGALRGFKDTRVPFLMNLFSYWVVGFPLAWVLGVRLALGPQSVWAGLAVGLTICALLLNGRFWWISRKAQAVPPAAATPGAAGRRGETAGEANEDTVLTDAAAEAGAATGRGGPTLPL
jgi:MATE family multidrug resistance protein